jgi:penicillin-binding protein 2
MKLFTSVAGLRAGLIAGSTHFLDKGTWSLPETQCKKGEPVECSKTNADRAVYGDLTLPGALTVSSDAFFYDLGARLWYETTKGSDLLQNELRSFGFGSRLGIQLPSENAGLVPDAKVKKQLALNGVIDKFAGSDYFTGDNVNLAIGQGFIGITPLQLANGYGSFANGGTVWKPRIAKALYEPGTADLAFHLADVAHAQISTTYLPEKFGDVDLPADIVDPIKRGLRGVVTQDKVNGFSSTAGAAFAGWDFDEFPIWGKTGTAQAGDQDSEKDTSLFASFGGPKDEPPKYAVASVIKYAGFGGQASAPVVKCIYEVLKDPALLPELLDYSPLDKTVVVPRQWPEHKDFDASCLNIATSGTVLRER